MSKTRKIVFAALMTSSASLCSQMSIPTPWGIPINLATLAVFLSGALMGRRSHNGIHTFGYVRSPCFRRYERRAACSHGAYRRVYHRLCRSGIYSRGHDAQALSRYVIHGFRPDSVLCLWHSLVYEAHGHGNMAFPDAVCAALYTWGYFENSCRFFACAAAQAGDLQKQDISFLFFLYKAGHKIRQKKVLEVRFYACYKKKCPLAASRVCVHDLRPHIFRVNSRQGCFSLWHHKAASDLQCAEGRQGGCPYL